MMSDLIIGIDPSIASTGISDGETHDIIDEPPTEEWEGGFDRIGRQMQRIYDFIAQIESTSQVNVRIYVEGPLLRAAHAKTENGSTKIIAHLFDMGAWFYAFMDFAQMNEWEVVTVSPSTLKKFVCGKGMAQKQQVLLQAFKKWNIEIGSDPGLDKLHAYCLVKYGEAVSRGDIQHEPYTRRGKSKGTSTTANRADRSSPAEIR